MFQRDQDWVLHMVYIRPSAPVISPSAIKPMHRSASLDAEYSYSGDAVVYEHEEQPKQEERRKREDRRQQKRDALLETRAGKDRRGRVSAISIKV